MKISVNKKRFYINILGFLGYTLLSYYVWFRFVRERLSRNIPFDLNLLSFVSLCIICIIYIYILYRIYVPITLHSVIYDKFRKTFLLVSKPFYYCDKLLKKYNMFYINLIKLYFNIILKLKLYKTENNKYFYILFNIIPKIIILVSFIIDVFYLKKFCLFYNVIITGSLPLIYNYSIYTIIQYLELISNKLEKNYNVVILSTEEDENEFERINDNMCFFVFISSLKYNDDNVLECKYFIDCQSANLMWNYQLYKYTCIETWFARKMYVKKHKLETPLLWIYKPESDEISRALVTEFHQLMPQAYYFKAFIETNNDITKTDLIQYDKYFIIGYLICWVYILIVSFHTLNIIEFIKVLNDSWKNIKEPFSNTNITIYKK